MPMSVFLSQHSRSTGPMATWTGGRKGHVRNVPVGDEAVVENVVGFLKITASVLLAIPWSDCPLLNGVV